MHRSPTGTSSHLAQRPDASASIQVIHLTPIQPTKDLFGRAASPRQPTHRQDEQCRHGAPSTGRQFFSWASVEEMLARRAQPTRPRPSPLRERDQIAIERAGPEAKSHAAGATLQSSPPTMYPPSHRPLECIGLSRLPRLLQLEYSKMDDSALTHEISRPGLDPVWHLGPTAYLRRYVVEMSHSSFPNFGHAPACDARSSAFGSNFRRRPENSRLVIRI